MNKKQKTLAIVSLLLNLISALLECLGVTAIVPLIAVILNKSTIHTNKIIQKIPFLTSLDYIQIVIFLCAVVIGLYFIKNVFFLFLTWFQTKFACKLQREMSINLLKSYMKCGYPYFLNHDIGYFGRGLGVDISNFYTVLTLFFALFSDFITSFLIFALLIFTDWTMSLSIFIAGIGSVSLMFFIFRKNMKKVGDQLRKYQQKIGSIQNQTIYGMKDIIILRRQNFFINSFFNNYLPYQNAQIKQNVGIAAPIRIIEAIFICAVIFMIGFKAITVEDPSVFIAKLAAFAMGSFRILPSLSRISSSINGISSRIASVSSLYDTIIESQNYTEEHPEIDFEKPISEEDKLYSDFSDSLKINNITFHYNEKLNTVLENINLNIKKGSSIAFIGKSGSGKSTLMDIILGLLVPEKGSITLDGIDIKNIPETWSKIVGYIPQTVFLTDGSIKENIAFGIQKDKIDEERIKQVIKQTELEELVNSLEKGADTPVGERGVRLSGGQRQRIAIARALYHNPKIMVLDEATSALDNETEAAIMSAINNLQGQVTLIIVAHRLTTVKNCDAIYRVADKTITEVDKKEIFN